MARARTDVVRPGMARRRRSLHDFRGRERTLFHEGRMGGLYEGLRIGRDRGLRRGRRQGAFGVGTLLLLGGAAWFLFSRTASPTAMPGVTPGPALPTIMPGESAEAYQTRAASTGLPYMTALDGLGHTFGREWYSWESQGPRGTAVWGV